MFVCIVYVCLHSLYVCMHSSYVCLHSLYVCMHSLYVCIHSLYIGISSRRQLRGRLFETFLQHMHGDFCKFKYVQIDRVKTLFVNVKER